jgi:hypothetical protein
MLPLSLILILSLKLFPWPSPELLYIIDDEPFEPRKSPSQIPLTNEGAAEYYWTMFFEPVKRQY